MLVSILAMRIDHAKSSTDPLTWRADERVDLDGKKLGVEMTLRTIEGICKAMVNVGVTVSCEEAGLP
jgi:hypothetical protein